MNGTPPIRVGADARQRIARWASAITPAAQRSDPVAVLDRSNRLLEFAKGSFNDADLDARLAAMNRQSRNLDSLGDDGVDVHADGVDVDQFLTAATLFYLWMIEDEPYYAASGTGRMSALRLAAFRLADFDTDPDVAEWERAQIAAPGDVDLPQIAGPVQPVFDEAGFGDESALDEDAGTWRPAGDGEGR